MGWDRTQKHILLSHTHFWKNIHPYPHTQTQQVLTFVSFQSPLDNEYNLVSIHVPVFLLLQY